MTKAQIEQFKELFTTYCREENEAGRCGPDTKVLCQTCPINQAYEEIFPAVDEMAELQEFQVTNIVWDTDGKEVSDLPTEVTVKALDEDDVLDVLSDTYGWCVTNCTIEKV